MSGRCRRSPSRRWCRRPRAARHPDFRSRGRKPKLLLLGSPGGRSFRRLRLLAALARSLVRVEALRDVLRDGEYVLRHRRRVVVLLAVLLAVGHHWLLSFAP